MSFGPREILILAVIFVILFGAKKLPDLARSLGRSARILKAETKGLADEDTPGTDDDPGAARSSGQAAQPPDAASGRAHPASEQHHQQQGYPQLPPGAQTVDETGQPIRHYGENRP